MIPPLSPLTVTCHVTRKKGNGIPLKPKGSIVFHIEHITKPRLQTLPAKYTLNNPNSIEITVFNDAIEDYHIEPNKEIEQIRLWGNNVECQRMQVKPLDIQEEFELIHKDQIKLKNENVTKKNLNKRPIFLEQNNQPQQIRQRQIQIRRRQQLRI